MVHNFGDIVAERQKHSEALFKVGQLLENKRRALGHQYISRQAFIDDRSVKLFGCEEWISLRHLFNIERGKNSMSIDMLIKLACALEVDAVDLFAEIKDIYETCR